MSKHHKLAARVLGLVLTALCVMGAGQGVSVAMKRQGLTKHDLAFYLSPEITNFVRPGLTVTIKSATINSASKVVVHFTITDLQGLPLDRLGVDTPGTVSTSWVLGYIPKGGELYTSYISHSVTSVD